LGVEYIKQQLRDTTPFQFDTQILNLRPLKLEDGFYPDLDEEKHGYFAVDNSYLENLEYDFKVNNLDLKQGSATIRNDSTGNINLYTFQAVSKIVELAKTLQTAKE
jgi:hypothetical protein